MVQSYEERTAGGCAYAANKAAPTVPRPDREMPQGTHKWELSWAVKENLMRYRHPAACCDWGEGEWRFREAIGHIHCTGVNDKTHRLNLYGSARLDGDQLWVYRPLGMAVPKVPWGVYQPADHYRLCANIYDDNWRLRNESTGKLLMVNGYSGSLHLNYLDKGSHIFHTESGVICPSGVFHFIDDSLAWEYEEWEVENKHWCKDTEGRKYDRV